MKKTDWWWLLAYPIYQTIGTIRHELGHALVGLLQGQQITEFVFFPGFRDGYLYFGYVRLTGTTTWQIAAGPYFLDVLTFVVFFAVCMWLPFKRHWLWLNLVIFGVLSPLLNSGYQYLKVGLNMYGDVKFLLEQLPPPAIHAFFIVTLGLYLAGTIVLFRRSRHMQDRRISA